MVSAWRNFKNIFPRPLFIIIFRPEMLKFLPYSILTGDSMVWFVIFCVLNCLRTLFCWYSIECEPNQVLFKRGTDFEPHWPTCGRCLQLTVVLQMLGMFLLGAWDKNSAHDPSSFRATVIESWGVTFLLMRSKLCRCVFVYFSAVIVPPKLFLGVLINLGMLVK